MAHPLKISAGEKESTGTMASGGSSVLDEYEWETLPDMLVARCYSVAAYHEGKLYVFGKQSQII